MTEHLPLFEEGVLYEVIVTTFNHKNKPNAAPMGVLFQKGLLILRPFFSSDTYRNLQQRKDCVINITTSPQLFVKAALFQEEFVADEFLTSPVNAAPILASCSHSYIAVRVISEVKESEQSRASLYCQVLMFDFGGLTPIPYSRAFSSLLEILIHATRICVFSNIPEKEATVKQLFQWIEHHKYIITRVTPKNSQYRTLLEKITVKLAPFKKR